MCMCSMGHSGHTGQTRVAHSNHEEAPLDTIKRRYAAGEITREQFEQMKRDLGVDAPPGSVGHVGPERG